MTTPHYPLQDVPSDFACYCPDEEHEFFTGSLPDELRFTPEMFDMLWNMHPLEHTVIMMHGRPVPIPRWQKAYGADYHFSGRTSEGLPVPPLGIRDAFLYQPCLYA